MRIMMAGLLALLLIGVTMRGDSPAERLCERSTPVQERQVLLRQVMTAYLRGKSLRGALAGKPARCLYLKPGDRNQGLFAYAYPTAEPPVVLFAWPNGTSWQMMPVYQEDGEGGPHPGWSHTAFRNGQPDLLIATEPSGSGRYGTVYHAAPDGSGALIARQVTQVFGLFEAEFLEPDLLLVTHACPSYGPLAWTCTTCFPDSCQHLLRWHRQERWMETVGKRFFTAPYVVANLFLGALQVGDDLLAAQYVTAPALVPEAKERLGLPVQNDLVPWNVANGGEVRQHIRELERRNWILLPPRHRTWLPAALRQHALALRRDEEQALLVMVREPRGWLIQAIKKDGVPLRTPSDG